MSTILRDERPVARKPHRCDLCDAVIPVGQRYRYVVSAGDYGGDFTTYRECAECPEVSRMVWDWAGHPCEGIDLTDADEWARETVDSPGPEGVHAVAYLTRRGILTGSES